ncbi:MAG: GNAT family N-acetyltransferase [Halioglobus sp.]
MDQLELRVIESTDELCASEQAWDQLWQASDVTVPSARARIVSLWVESFSPGVTFRALTVECNGLMVGALPIAGQKFLSLLNAGMLPCNAWAASGDLLIRTDVEIEPVLDKMVSGIEMLPWRRFVFEQIPYSEPRWVAFRSALIRAGLFTSALEQHRVGQVEISSDWAAYEKTRKSRHRQRRRRNARMLEKDGGSELKVYSALAPEEVESSLLRGFEVEERSWKESAGTAVLGNKKISHYYLKEARQLAIWGQLELVFLEHNEVPIAFCYGWNAKGVRFCVKVGYDEAYAKYGPGQQQILKLLERIHEDRQCVLYDFHGRLVPWTESWITKSYPVGRLLVVSSGAANKCFFTAYTKLQPILKRTRTRIRQRFQSTA